MKEMIRLTFAAAFAITITAAPAVAEEGVSAQDTGAGDEGPSWTLQIDPLTTYLGFVHLQVERALSDAFSIYAGPHLRLFTPPTSDPQDYTGLGVEIGGRWFFLGGAPSGPWAMSRVVIARATDGERAEAAGYVSGLIGYTAIFGDVFVLSGGAGVQYIHYGVDEVGTFGVYPALHTALGVAF